MSNSELISICIPTYKRSDLLKQAIQSCLDQEYRPLEILVGDDSPTDEAASIIRGMASQDVTWRYLWNRPSRGQAGNVSQLFQEASAEKLILLHDDDLLMPGAIRTLLGCWDKDPKTGAAFGKQYITDHEGHILEGATENLNRYFYRTAEYAGARLTPMESALVQQFPNDAYMIRSGLAREVLFRPRELVGELCDFDFGMRAAAAAQRASERFIFIDTFTAKYRATTQSLSRGLVPAAQMFELLESVAVAPESTWAKRIALERLAPLALMGHAVRRERREALHIYWSDHYPWQRRLSPGGLRKLATILAPAVFSRSGRGAAGQCRQRL